MATSYASVSTADLRALLGALPDAVLTSDSAGNVGFLNRAAERFTGHRCETVLGRPVEEVLPLGNEVDGIPLENPVGVCLRGEGPLGPFEAKLLDGPGTAGRVVDVSVAPIRNPAGATTGTILIARDVTRARQVAWQLSHQATHDALTGLMNRTEFDRRLTQAVVNATKQGGKHALGFLDLDGFKRINDACGHLAGDQLLQELSSLVRGLMRARDTVARLGGDEFGILLEHCSPAKAARIADNIRKVISDHQFTCDGRTYSIGASIGIVPVRDRERSPTQLLRAADAACYQAKRRGGNRVQLIGIHHRALPPGRRLRSTAQSSKKIPLPGGAHADISRSGCPVRQPAETW